MIQNQPILKRLTSLNGEDSAAQNVKKRLLRKANTLPQQMMEEFLVRQELYEKMYKAPMEKPIKLKNSKLITLVHQARQRFLEFKQQKEAQSVVEKRMGQQKVIDIMKRKIVNKVNDPLPIKPQEKDFRDIIMKIILILILTFIFFILN